MENFTNRQKMILLFDEYHTLEYEIEYYHNLITEVIYKMEEKIDNASVEELNNDIDYMASLKEYVDKLEKDKEEIGNQIIKQHMTNEILSVIDDEE